MYRSLGLLVVLLFGSLLPARSLAYCQATTMQASAACPSACSTVGTPVHWGTREIEYAFNMRGFPGLDEARVRAAIAASFAAWEGVACQGRALGFRFSALAATTDLTVGPQEAEPNLNVISLLSADEWQRLGFGAAEFARTKLWFDERSGEIMGADIAFNGAIMPLTVCGDSASCDASMVDLQNVATHEIGHFLGLAHSDDPTATMWCAAQRGDREKRSLEADDALGLCSAYEDGAAFVDRATEPSSSVAPPRQDGCALGAGGRGADCAPLFMLVFALSRRRSKHRV